MWNSGKSAGLPLRGSQVQIPHCTELFSSTFFWKFPSFQQRVSLEEANLYLSYKSGLLALPLGGNWLNKHVMGKHLVPFYTSYNYFFHCCWLTCPNLTPWFGKTNLSEPIVASIHRSLTKPVPEVTIILKGPPMQRTCHAYRYNPSDIRWKQVSSTRVVKKISNSLFAHRGKTCWHSEAFL